jgi:hypothetical protein
LLLLRMRALSFKTLVTFPGLVTHWVPSRIVREVPMGLMQVLRLMSKA